MSTLYRELDPGRVVDLDLGSPEFKQSWREHVPGWALRDPFYIVTEGAPPLAICGRYVDVQEVYQDNERFSTAVPKRPGYEMFDKFMGVRVLAQMDGEAHSRVRRLLTPAFSPRGIARLEDGIGAVVDELLDGIERDGREFDGMEDFGARLIVEVMLTVLLGLNDEQKAVFQEMHRVIPLITYTKPGQPYPAVCVDAFDNARRMILELIEERRATPQDDFLNDLITARDEGDRLSDTELFDQVFTVCAGALSGTTLAFGGILHTMYSHPDQLNEVLDDMSLLPAAVEECMRWNKGGYLTFPRFALSDTIVGGTPIYKDMVVRVSPQAADYDPLMFPDPLRFDIHRNPKHTIVFGGGAHFCLGHRLARVSMLKALTGLMNRFPRARLQDVDYSPTYGGSVGELKILSLPMLAH